MSSIATKAKKPKKKNRAAQALAALALERRRREPKLHQKIMAAMAEGHKKIPAAVRTASASKAGSAISPEMAHERAMRAWATRRKNASKY